MLHHISWQEYWTTLALLTAGYYLTLYFHCFRGSINLPLFSRPASTPTASPAVSDFLKQQNQPSLFEDEGENDFTPPPAGSDEGGVYACMDELNAYFEEARRRKTVKGEVVYSLQQILAKYPSLATSSYKESLTNVIITEAGHHCSLHLSAEDMVRVWRGA